MIVRFWGVRGSIPCPGPNTVKYGGNTSCIELIIKELNHRVIIDAGSGIRELGNYLLKENFTNKKDSIKIFLTHTHWDHIMGFPFFAPMYMADSNIKIFGPRASENNSLEEIVGGQWTYNYFPILHKDLAAKVEYIELEEGIYDLEDGLLLKTQLLSHPIACLGYRFEFRNRSFCTIYDTEPFNNINQIIEFAKNVDLLVHDAQYTKDEYDSTKAGWGHSYIEYALDIAKKANVKKLAFFHHDPDRTDEELDKLSIKYNCYKINSFFAKEKQEIIL